MQMTCNFIIGSTDIVDFKILEPHWLVALWPISQGPDFSQIWNLRRNIANNTKFHYRSNSEKIGDYIFQ